MILAPILAILLFIVFAMLSGFHFYWLFGGVWGAESVIPSKGEEPNSIAIPKIATLVVALGLLFIGLLYLNITGWVSIPLPNWVEDYVYWIIPSVFLLRAIGEFNYVGLFKKVRHTKFAKADSKIFVPLCLGIGLIGFLLLAI